MPLKNETRAGKARASRNTGGYRFQREHTHETFRAQILILKAGVRPDWAAMLVGLAFGEARMGKFRPPWERVPAGIVESRSEIVRFWAVFRHVDGVYISVLVGGRDPFYEGLDRTDGGALYLVKSALERLEVRQDPPVVICDHFPLCGHQTV